MDENAGSSPATLLGVIVQRNRRDINQKEILRCLKRNKYKCSVTADIKNGFPDIIVRAHSGIWVMFEIKSGNDELTPDEKTFQSTFCDTPYHVITSCEQALEILRHYDMQQIVIWRERYESSL
jgi:hypothetical protein